MAATNKPNRILKIALVFSIVINLLFIGNHFVKKYVPSNISFIPKKKTYYLNRQTVFDVLPITNNDIVFAGDSHTQFFEVNEYLKDCTIKNRGIYDDVSVGLLHRMNQITPGHPKKIFIEIGFNDIAYNFTSDSVYTNIKLMVEKIKKESPNTAIYVNSIFPSARDYYKALVPAFNTKIKKLCTDYKIPYIDVYAKLSTNGKLDNRYDCGDGIHLNGAGYLVWSACLKSYL